MCLGFRAFLSRVAALDGARCSVWCCARGGVALEPGCRVNDGVWTEARTWEGFVCGCVSESRLGGFSTAAVWMTAERRQGALQGDLLYSSVLRCRAGSSMRCPVCLCRSYSYLDALRACTQSSVLLYRRTSCPYSIAAAQHVAVCTTIRTVFVQLTRHPIMPSQTLQSSPSTPKAKTPQSRPQPYLLPSPIQIPQTQKEKAKKKQALPPTCCPPDNGSPRMA